MSSWHACSVVRILYYIIIYSFLGLGVCVCVCFFVKLQALNQSCASAQAKELIVSRITSVSKLLDDDRFGWPSMEPNSWVPFGLGKQLGYPCILGAGAADGKRARGGTALFEVPLVVQWFVSILALVMSPGKCTSIICFVLYFEQGRSTIQISRTRNAGQAVLEWRRTTKAKGIVLHALLGAIPFWHKQGFVEVEDIWV